MKPVFFDHNSTTAINFEVVKLMAEIASEPLNSSATHFNGRKAQAIINKAKSQILSALNAHNYEIIFTSSATEATNTIFFGGDFTEILFSKIEHASVYNCRPENRKITEINCDSNGIVETKNLLAKIPQNSAKFLVSIMACNNETGVLQPIEEFAKITHQNLGLFHSDLVQALGKIPVDLEKLNIDFASISAHKIHGPAGVGALIYRKDLDFKPLILGGKQQNSKRAGSLNIAGIAGFGLAVEIAQKNLQQFQKIAILRDYLEENLLKITGGEENLKIFGKNVPRLANTCFYAVKNLNNQTQLINFDLNNICVSAGASCSSGSVSSSKTLQAMNVASEFLSGSIRISLSNHNNLEEINYFLKIFNEFYNKKIKKL